jgi:hypothetical protein
MVRKRRPDKDQAVKAYNEPPRGIKPMPSNKTITSKEIFKFVEERPPSMVGASQQVFTAHNDEAVRKVIICERCGPLGWS